MLPHPCLYCGSPPHPAAREFDFSRRKVWVCSLKLVHALPLHSEHLGDLRYAYKMAGHPSHFIP